MDQQLAADVLGVAEPTVAVMVDVAMRSFLKVYDRRRAFVEIYLRGRTNATVHAYGRQHNVRVAETLHAYAIEAGLSTPALTPAKALLSVEIGDQILQLAFEHDPAGDESIITEGIAMLIAYLERYATPRGLGRRS